MQTRSRADRFSAHGQRKTRRILQYSRTAKCDFAVKRACTAGGTKFRFKFIRRYGANLLNLYAYARQCKFFKILRRSDIAGCVHIAKHTAKRCFRKIRLHEIPHAKSLSRTLRPRYVSFWRATRLLVRQISRHAAQVRTPLQSRHLKIAYFPERFLVRSKTFCSHTVRA